MERLIDSNFASWLVIKVLMKSGTFPLLAQVIRYGIVGVLNNLLGYLIYLALTWLWLDPKIAVTLLYPIGALTAYFGHARYSFSYKGGRLYGLLRYIIAQFIGYGTDILMLYVFSDRLGLPHQVVQAAAIVVVGGILFLLFKYFVFSNRLGESSKI